MGLIRCVGEKFKINDLLSAGSINQSKIFHPDRYAEYIIVLQLL